MRTNRQYKRADGQFRDANYFLIACEGANREKDYFQTLALSRRNKRLKVCIISPQDANTDESEIADSRHKSAPKWALSRVVKFVEENGINFETGDCLWFVLDTDRWGKVLFEIKQECDKSGWQMALSNPCFEVWLILHVADIQNVAASTCQEFKREIPLKFQGGYNVQVFTQKDFVEKAMERAAAIDLVEGAFPELKTTKVHKVALELLEMLG
jgi:hypothetical protein